MPKAQDKVEKNKPVRRRAGRMSPEARRSQLINCGVKAFAQKGILNATHADVSAIAEVSIPTVFHYFPTIENLRAEVIKAVNDYLIDGFVTSRWKLEVAAFERLEDMLDSFCRAVDEEPDFTMIWLEWSGLARGELWELYKVFYRNTVAAISKIIVEGAEDNTICDLVSPEDGARVVLGMAHTVVHMRLSGSSPEVTKHTIHSLVSLYLAPRAVGLSQG